MGSYLPLAGGTMTGAIEYKDGANPNSLRMMSVVADGAIDALTGSLYLSGNTGKSIFLQIYNGATFDTYLTVTSTAITAATTLAMGSNAITTSSTVDGIDISAHAANITTIHLADQSGHTGQFLKSNGTTADWAVVDLSAYLPLAGGTMSGAINMAGYDLQQVSYIKSLDATPLRLSYGTTTPATKLTIDNALITAAVAIHSDVTTGTAPITVDSTTVCTNLNADTIDSYGLDSGTVGNFVQYGTGKLVDSGTAPASFAAYAHTHSGVYLPLAGGTMSGAIAMGTYGVTGTGDVLPHDSGNHYCGDSTHQWISSYSRTVNVPNSGGGNTYITTEATTNNMVLTATGAKFKFVV